jgi:hypothetical protein
MRPAVTSPRFAAMSYSAGWTGTHLVLSGSESEETRVPIPPTHAVLPGFDTALCGARCALVEGPFLAAAGQCRECIRIATASPV